MGGLRTKIPWTFGTFLIGTLAIAGIPLLAGFFSKDEILLAALGAGHTVLFGIALFTALLTAVLHVAAAVPDLLRRVPRRPRGRAPRPRVALVDARAARAARGRARSWPASSHDPATSSAARVLRRAPSEAARAHVALAAASVATLVAASLGILIAWYLYLAMPELRGLARRGRFAPALRALRRQVLLRRRLRRLRARASWWRAATRLLWKRVDAGLIDGIVNGAGTPDRGRSPRRCGRSRPASCAHYALLDPRGARSRSSRYLLWLR